MKNYSQMIRFRFDHYDVCDEYGSFLESCDTYEEAQDVVDRYVDEHAA